MAQMTLRVEDAEKARLDTLGSRIAEKLRLPKLDRSDLLRMVFATGLEALEREHAVPTERATKPARRK